MTNPTAQTRGPARSASALPLLGRSNRVPPAHAAACPSRTPRLTPGPCSSAHARSSIPRDAPLRPTARRARPASPTPCATRSSPARARAPLPALVSDELAQPGHAPRPHRFGPACQHPGSLAWPSSARTPRPQPSGANPTASAPRPLRPGPPVSLRRAPRYADSPGPHVRVPFLPRHPLRAAPASISPRSPASFPCWPARRDLRLCLFNHPRRTRSPIPHAIAAPNPNTPRPPLPPEQSRCSTAATPHHPAPTLANRLRGFALTPRSTPSLCS